MKLKPTQISIREGLERYRKDLGEVEELADSISRLGQIQPIAINENYELIAGGRRLAACTLLGIEVDCVIIDENDPLAMREMELEENVQRKDFTPAEHVLAVKELHDLKVEVNKLTPPKDGQYKSWRIDDTADIIGKEVSTIKKDIILAKLVEQFPELKKCKTKKELTTAGKALQKLTERTEGFSTLKALLENSNQVNVRNIPAADFIQSLPTNSVDIVICDPPYGIEVHENAIGLGGKTGGDSNMSGVIYRDSCDYARKVIQDIIVNTERVCKETSHLYMFTGIENFEYIKSILAAYGFSPYHKPLIWYKPGQGQANMPERWPVTSYEIIVYARRAESKLLYARPDVLTYNRVPPGDRVHQAQKPIELLQDIITRSVYPGSTLLDPCMGSGSSLVAGLREGLVVHGCDELEEAYNGAVSFISSELEKEEQHG